MPKKDYRVTVVMDYTAEWDEDSTDADWEPDDDWLHDAIMDRFDTVDLETEAEHPLYDENGDERDDETRSVGINCDNVREIEVLVLND